MTNPEVVQSLTSLAANLERDIAKCARRPRSETQAEGARTEAQSRWACDSRQLLDEVQAAIGRIHDNTYGVCQECGGAISEPRLRAIPYTRYCMACQERLDHPVPGKCSPSSKQVLMAA